jgi:hypothetical protein
VTNPSRLPSDPEIRVTGYGEVYMRCQYLQRETYIVKTSDGPGLADEANINAYGHHPWPSVKAARRGWRKLLRRARRYERAAARKTKRTNKRLAKRDAPRDWTPLADTD